jgi:branched-chain amino acid transport system ATP-binding protein
MSVAASPLLTCGSITKRFGGVLALKELSLDIKRDEVLGIIGPNGSGKTTLFNVISGLVPATSGWIRYEGQTVSGWSPQKLHRAGISRTFQRSRLCLEASIFDNLMIGKHTQLSNGIAFNLFNRAGLRKEVDEQMERCRQLLDLFDPKLVERIDDLAGSQPMIDRRRIEVCRALISAPKLLLLDEPSAGMTEYETHQLMENILLIKERFKELTVALIEHEMSVIKKVTDRCVVLNFGSMICEGSYEEVTDNPEVQEAYLGAQLENAS